MKKILLVFLVSLFLISQGYCADQWAPAQPAGTASPSDIDALVIVNNNAIDRFLAYGRFDCKLAYSSASQLTVAAGGVICSNSGATTRRFRTNTSATTVTWANIESGGAEAASTTYYVWAVADTDAATFTCVISTSSTVPTGCTYYKRLGSFYNDASSNITQITDDSDNDISCVRGQGNFYKIDSGTTTIGSSATATVSFDFTYASAPVVVYGYYPATAGTLPDHTRIELYQVPTTTECVFYQNAGAAGTVIEWMSIGQVLAQ